MEWEEVVEEFLFFVDEIVDGVGGIGRRRRSFGFFLWSEVDFFELRVVVVGCVDFVKLNIIFVDVVIVGLFCEDGWIEVVGDFFVFEEVF